MFIRSESGKLNSGSIETKGLHDLVTYVDKTSEERLTSGLSKLLPGSGFIAEEGTGTRNEKGYNWIIDPLDGTTNFIHQVPCFAISVALMLDDKMILGIVYEINRDECFYAWEEGPAFLNGKEIHVTSTASLHDSLLATGFPYNDFTLMDKYLKVFRHLMQNTRGIRRIGSAATDLCYVACGRFDAFFEYSLKPWDMAAGTFIIQRAGGKVCDFSGGNNFLFGKQVIAGSPLITKALLLSFQEYFN